MNLYWELVVLSVSMFLLGFYIGTYFAQRKVNQLNEKISFLRSSVIRRQLEDIDYGRR